MNYERRENILAYAISSLQVDQLHVLVFSDRVAAGRTACKHVATKMRELLASNERIRMIFAAAPSQNEFLDALSTEWQIDWNRVTVFQMDEYVDLPSDDARTFANYLRSRLFDRVHPGIVHVIDASKDVQEACLHYSSLLREAPIDIVCLGIGENGHLAFNDPSVANFRDPEAMKLVTLDAACRMQQVHDGSFVDFSAVPKQAVTLTIPALLSAKYLYGIVSGENKHVAVTQTLTGPISEDCPASILRTHPNCTLFLDRLAYGYTYHDDLS